MAVDLLEWALNYFNFYYSARGIKCWLKTAGNNVELNLNNETKRVVCVEKLTKIADKGVIIVTYNNRHNIKVLIDNWNDFCDRGQRLYFVDKKDPNRKWVINPKVHRIVCDKKNLRKSILAMSQLENFK